jgi:hypothetical protein
MASAGSGMGLGKVLSSTRMDRARKLENDEQITQCFNNLYWKCSCRRKVSKEYMGDLVSSSMLSFISKTCAYRLSMQKILLIQAKNAVHYAKLATLLAKLQAVTCATPNTGGGAQASV